ncbi:hypothetical protein K1719_033893 [Acacia pycnantha]|nr:hypothetical protein K1719_033893 [Acacia pycnantha]
MIGKMIKVDRSTSVYDKGGFARICVELDLKKPLVPTYMVFGEERQIIYEGLHHVCFACGKYGHQKTGCPLQQDQASTQAPVQESKDAGTGGIDVPMAPSETEAGSGGAKTPERDLGKNDTGGPRTEKSVAAGGGSVVTGGEVSDENCNG